MTKTKVLITVKTYPLPSRSYDELVCTAGFLEDGSWIRIYPVPFRFLKETHIYKKYQWRELRLKKRDFSKDFRPESYSPFKSDMSDMRLLNELDTKNYWESRKDVCLRNVYTNLSKLIHDSQQPRNVSLATFKPSKIFELRIEAVDREWKKEWIDQLNTLDLFTNNDSSSPREPIRKVPYKFSYRFADETGKESTLMIEDWEIGALYWNCLKTAKGNEEVALQLIRKKYEDDFIPNKELYFFLGTTAEAHRRRWKNPFVIIGVFYPPLNPNPERQLKLF